MHLWWAFLDRAADGSRDPVACLSTEERARAAGIASEAARRRWIASRAALRRVLAPYVGLTPERLAFGRDGRGRPFLRDPGAIRRPGPAGPLCGRGLRFNLAHSADLAVVAVGRRVPVGVDVELVRPLAAPGPLMQRVLTPAERAAVEAVPAADRPRELLLRWVRKEAGLKALGVGLGPGRSATTAAGWTRRLLLIRTFEPEPGYVAALAVGDRGARPRLRGRPGSASG